MVRVIILTVKKIEDNQLFIYAGHTAYMSLLALFPFVIFLIAVAGFLGSDNLAEAIIGDAFEVMPDAVVQTVAPVIRDIIGGDRIELATLAIFGTLWVAISGVEALRTGLNKVYEVQDFRAYWKRRMQSMVVVVIGALLFLLLAMVIILAPLVLRWVGLEDSLSALEIFQIGLLRYLAGVVILMLTFTVLFKHLPGRPVRWHRAWPGALIAAVLWLILASLFSLFLKNFGHYDVTYGSLAGAIITIIFLHYSVAVVLLGAQINVVHEQLQEEKRAKKSDYT